MNNNVGPVLTYPGWFDVEESDYKWHKESNTGTAKTWIKIVKFNLKLNPF
jgi:hypothetical protein